MGLARELLPAIVLLISALLTRVVRQRAVARGVLDIPNERSSHTTATPRGGGIAIVAAFTAAVLLMAALGTVSSALCRVLVGGGLGIAVVGFLDDRKLVPVRLRLLVHLLAGAWAVYWLGGLTSVRIGDHVAQLGWIGGVLAVVGIAWVLNLFNFMDGIDGIASSEAIFVALGGALLTPAMEVRPEVAGVALVFAAACGGFLLWNWPPASIFLGDVGSGYLGYVVAVLALSAGRDNPNAVWVWLILGGAFFVDATVTLVRRLLRQQRVYEAHRSHAYQWLARRWRSHAKVTVALMMVNLAWLLPWAVLAVLLPHYGIVMVIAALAPLAALALTSGAGRAESDAPER